MVGAIHSQRATNKALVHGAIRCLALLSDDIDEQQLPQARRGGVGRCREWQERLAPERAEPQSACGAVGAGVAPWGLRSDAAA